MKLLISEVMKKASNAKTKAQKIKILRDNNTQALRSVLKWNFDPGIKSVSYTHLTLPTICSV